MVEIVSTVRFFKVYFGGYLGHVFVVERETWGEGPWVEPNQSARITKYNKLMKFTKLTYEF